MRRLLENAHKEKRATGAFSVANLEMILGVILAAEKTNTPVILQIAEARLNTSPLYLIGPAMLAAARNAKVDVAVHLDHGLTLECIREAIDLGFTSVMFDGSHLPLEENIAKTKQIVSLAHGQGVNVEAEIGRVGRTENGEEAPIAYADPNEALRFIEETKVDALAAGIGNAHGVYTAAPQLRFDILDEISRNTHVPLVLHGGTGISPEDFRRAISLGVRKINIATACFQASALAAHEAQETNIFDVSRRMTDATEKAVLEHLNIFGLAAKETK
jgi:fructose-bisphosphate aldolase class II